MKTENRNAGFNLVELLVAITVLAVVVTIMASIFRHSEAAWTQNTGEDSVENGGRVALNMLTRDLQGAVADIQLSFSFFTDRDVVTSYGFTNAEINFIALQSLPARTNRATSAVMYWVREAPGSPGRYELVRSVRPVDPVNLDCYTNALWYDNPPTGFGRPTGADACSVVAENVAGFRLATPETGSEFYMADELPSRLDIYLELLPERDARQAADLQARGMDPLDLVERTARRFTTTVCFPNRDRNRLR